MKIFLAMPKDNEVTKSFFTPEVYEKLSSLENVIYFPGDKCPSQDEFIKYGKGCDVVITGWGHPVITSEMIKATKKRELFDKPKE